MTHYDFKILEFMFSGKKVCWKCYNLTMSTESCFDYFWTFYFFFIDKVPINRLFSRY